jgi:hypothetical protein
VASAEIHSIQSVSGNQPRVRRIIEEAGQTFLPGTPVQIAADGGVKAWDGVTVANGIAGFSKEFGNNLAALGVLPTAAVNPTPQPSTGQAIPFEPSAVSISRPLFRDGRQGFEIAVADTVFLGQVGPAQTILASDVGKQYGMTIDADNHWYVDKTKSGASAVVIVVKPDPNDQSATPRGVYFTVLPSAAQLVA